MMKNSAKIARYIPLLAAAIVVLMPARLPAQSSGRIDYVARVAPTDGRPEPVRQFTFYLLRKSLADIRQQTLQLDPPPDLDKYIDSLTVSPKLKEWMKKQHTVQLSGSGFAKSLTPDDIIDVKEFFEAYMSRNQGFEGIGFPKPKFKEKDRTANTEKYQQLRKEYIEAIRTFITAVPDSVQGIEADLGKFDSSSAWETITAKQRSRLESDTLELAQMQYLVAQSDTNLEGHGIFADVPAGNYWIGTLRNQAIAGDVRLRWDLQLTVRSGETTHVELSNVNALRSNTDRISANR